MLILTLLFATLIKVYSIHFNLNFLSHCKTKNMYNYINVINIQINHYKSHVIYIALVTPVSLWYILRFLSVSVSERIVQWRHIIQLCHSLGFFPRSWDLGWVQGGQYYYTMFICLAIFLNRSMTKWVIVQADDMSEDPCLFSFEMQWKQRSHSLLDLSGWFKMTYSCGSEMLVI